MIQPTTSNILSSDAVTGMSIEMNASMFSLLTKNVYNDIILAPIREWSTNAIDACLDQDFVVYDVHIPTMSDPVFSVRDYGTGLSEEDILGLFSTLGASTKRDSNRYNGTFGIGRMSALAYTSSFTVDSYFNGTHYSYLISIQDGIPGHIKLLETPTSEPNGLKLSLTVNQSDISKFVSKAEKFYRYVEHQPDINIEIPEPNYLLEHDNWAIDRKASSYYVLMGNVIYSLDRWQLSEVPPSGTILKMPIGSVSITPGRESLTYDASTVQSLEAAIKQQALDIDTIVHSTLTSITSPFELAYEYASIMAKLDLVISPPSHLSSYFTAYHKSVKFSLGSYPFAAKHGYQSTAAKSYALSVRSLKQHTLVIQDIPKFSDAYRYFTESTTYILKPESNSLASIKNMLENAVPILDQLKIPYKYISEFIPEQETKAKTVRNSIPTSSFTRSYYDGRVYKDSLLLNTKTETKTWLYLPINGTTPIHDATTLNAVHAACHILDLNFTFVPKKSMKAVQASSNFHLATDYLAKALKNKTFRSSDEPYISSTFKCHEIYSIAPTKIRRIAKYLNAYSKCDTKNASYLNQISKVFPIKIRSCKYTSADIKKLVSLYPLMEDYTSNYNKSKLIHYLKLEKFYEENSNH